MKEWMIMKEGRKQGLTERKKGRKRTQGMKEGKNWRKEARKEGRKKDAFSVNNSIWSDAASSGKQGRKEGDGNTAKVLIILLLCSVRLVCLGTGLAALSNAFVLNIAGYEWISRAPTDGTGDHLLRLLRKVCRKTANMANKFLYMLFYEGTLHLSSKTLQMRWTTMSRISLNRVNMFCHPVAVLRRQLRQIGFAEV